MRATKRAVVWLAAAAVLALTFALYLQPQTVFDLASRVWSCF